jgi:hypothetical protein
MSTTEGLFVLVGLFLLFFVALAVGAVIKSVWDAVFVSGCDSDVDRANKVWGDKD